MTLPNLDGREMARRTRARTAGFITVAVATIYAVMSGSHFRSWAWLLWVVGLTLNLVVAMPAFRARFGGRRGRRGAQARSGASHSRPESASPVTTHRWHALVIASRLMPRSAGDRWLAEAESTLSEITKARRGPALRSYLLSVPRLVPVMWAREITRLSRRRPG
jgi:hypothetical protein